MTEYRPLSEDPRDHRPYEAAEAAVEGAGEESAPEERRTAPAHCRYAMDYRD
ncbi:hypothetical protein ACFVUH_21495 [Kitasatospora sp. NPDC058032]|uniref:hypothetical protein n=1 Tax=Kitasatospora sp. NPDC058032 TaxID=3346307 RepID=UPI0036DB58F2